MLRQSGVFPAIRLQENPELANWHPRQLLPRRFGQNTKGQPHSTFELHPPFFDSHEGKPQTQFGKGVTARSRRRTSLATSLPWWMRRGECLRERSGPVQQFLTQGLSQILHAQLHAKHKRRTPFRTSMAFRAAHSCTANVQWFETKRPRAPSSSSRPPACTCARTCDSHTPDVCLPLFV